MICNKRPWVVVLRNKWGHAYMAEIDGVFDFETAEEALEAVEESKIPREEANGGDIYCTGLPS